MWEVIKLDLLILKLKTLNHYSFAYDFDTILPREEI